MTAELQKTLDTFIKSYGPKRGRRRGPDNDVYEKAKDLVSAVPLPAAEYEEAIRYVTGKLGY